jgi:serine/threonine-protein kinase
MGVVVAAQHLQLGQTVAIKVLSAGEFGSAQWQDACTRFLREGQAAARLTSDHVVRIYDVGTLDSGAPFMVMELLRGDDLSALLERQGPPPVEVAVDFIVQACDAIGEAHASGIVHRDLKPSNLFVSRRNDGRPVVKVLDFGISKALSSGAAGYDGNLTQTRSIVGSPYYMSPEQVRDAKRVDTRTDIWSIGMILYELLIGEPAFNAETLPGICAAIAADQPVPPRVRRRDVSAEIDGIIMRCLEKDPARRFQTIGELVQALSPFVPVGIASLTVEYASRRPGAPSVAAEAPRVSADYATVQLDAPVSGPREVSLRSDPGLDAGRQEASADGTGAVGAASQASRSAQLSAEVGASATLVSPSGRTHVAPVASVGSSPPTSHRFLIAGAIVGLLAAGGAFAALGWPRPVPPSHEPVGPARFTLTLESSPVGARVLEGDRVLGVTPLPLGLDNAELLRAPRHFALILDGFEPYPVVQGASDGSVRVFATLVPAKPVARAPSAGVAAPAAAPEPMAAPARRAEAPLRALHPPPRAPAAQVKPAPAADIRLER